MKVTLLTIGSRGDIQPFIALAQGLARAGHNVMLGGPPDFAELAASYQVPFTPIGVSMQTFLQDSTVKRAITGGGVLRFMRTRSARRAELYAQLNREALALCQGSDVIIYKNAVLSAFGIAQKLGISCAEVRLQPYTPTTAFPAFILKGRASYGALINWLSGFALQTVVWQILRNDVKAFWHDELRLPPLPSLWPDRMLAKAGARVFHPISPHVLPRPPGWPAHLHFTGYWFLGPPPGWSPPVELVRFLEAGEPPVYIGFGSIPNQEPRAAFALIARALERSGQRGVVYGGWGGLYGAGAGNRVMVIESVPHEWLFPHTKAVVHHGGAGTTAAGLRAGVPNVVVPFFADQPFWGWRVAALGAGPAPLLRQRLTAERLASAIEQATNDPVMRRRANEIGERLRAEDGIAQTIELIRG